MGRPIDKLDEHTIGYSPIFGAISSLLERCPKETKLEREKSHLVGLLDVDVGDRNENLSDCSQKRCIFREESGLSKEV